VGSSRAGCGSRAHVGRTVGFGYEQAWWDVVKVIEVTLRAGKEGAKGAGQGSLEVKGLAVAVREGVKPIRTC